MSSPLPRATTTAEIIKKIVENRIGGEIGGNQTEFKYGGSNRRLIKGATHKNIKSSINKLSLRNQDLFGPAGHNLFTPYLPNKKDGGGWLDSYT